MDDHTDAGLLTLDNLSVLPMVVWTEDRELFRVTTDLRFEWGDALDIDETARVLAETVTSMLRGFTPGAAP